jgi:hypothetical protein
MFLAAHLRVQACGKGKGMPESLRIKKFWIFYYLGISFLFAFALTIPHYFFADSCIRNSALMCDFFVGFGGNTMRWIFFTGMWFGVMFAAAWQFLFLTDPTFEGLWKKVGYIVSVFVICTWVYWQIYLTARCLDIGVHTAFRCWARTPFP